MPYISQKVDHGHDLPIFNYYLINKSISDIIVINIVSWHFKSMSSTKTTAIRHRM